MSFGPTTKYARWNSSQVQEFFLSRGITYSGLDYCRIQEEKRGSLEDRLYKAGETFRIVGWHDFTGTELAMLIYNDLWDQEHAPSYLSTVYGKLSHVFGKKSARYPELSLPAIHILRIKTDNYGGNLHQTKGYELEDGNLVKSVEAPYPNVLISPDDWRESLTLPLPVMPKDGWVKIYNHDIVMTLGLIWGLGHLSFAHKRTSIKHLELSGSSDQYELFNNDIADSLRNTFNFKPEIEDYKHKKPQYISNMIIPREGPYIRKGSLAITSWLEYELGFPFQQSSKRKIPLPKLTWTEEQINVFLNGIFKTANDPKTRRTKRDKWKTYDWSDITYQEGDKMLRERLDSLLTSAGHN